MRGKLIVIEGTDCSGKETQSKLLVERLTKDGINIQTLSFPMYDTPTGKIVGGPYLGKANIGEGWFKEGANQVDPMVASLYFAADRRYNLPMIDKLLASGVNVILDRYVYSNMAHQGGKITDSKARFNLYDWLDTLEFKLLNLPRPDIALFLHMPYFQACVLKANRHEALDQHEMNSEHLKHAERAYIELAKQYHWQTIECVKHDEIRTIMEINDDIYHYLKDQLK